MHAPDGDSTLPHESELDEATSTDGAVPVVAPAIGELIGRYQVRRLLGESTMSQVYLARDTVLGRSVALKLIRDQRVTAAEAEVLIREAQVTSRLNHPNIVQLYDAGLHRRRAFLALEFLDGETLQKRMQVMRPSIDEALRIAHAVASGLEHAHLARVFHCDLKPGNIMIPTDGRPRIVDFGLATVVGDRSIFGGTPDWMAPEQWRHAPVSDRTDIWSLGIVIHQLLTGEHPFGAAADRASRRTLAVDLDRLPDAVVRADVPDSIKVLLIRSLARDPASRPAAREWEQVLHAATSASVTTIDLESPFRGLFAFDERHSHLFFGREREIDSFLERLRQQPTLPVVGPSGAGKSSFMHAGVIPRLRARERWCVISMRPGADAFAALARQLLEAASDSAAMSSSADEVISLASELRERPTLLAARLATLAAARTAPVLLVCDQLEEVFTQSADLSVPRLFVEMLMSAADDPSDRIRVTYTLRDDFIGHMPEVRHVFVLRQLTTADLRRTVTTPLERLGYKFENDVMLDEMLAELPGSALDLPLLQFACGRLWDSRDRERRLLLSSAYREHGGVVRALALHADAVLAELPVGLHSAARALLTALVTPSRTRKMIPADSVLSTLPEGAQRVADHLVTGRLLTRHRVPGEDAVMLEIAHESLIATWDQLARWLDASNEQRRAAQQFEEAAASWRARGHRDEHAPTRDELLTARERIARLEIAVTDDVQAFLQAGERRHAAQRRRSRIRIGAFVVLAVAITMGSLGLARSFRAQKDDAEAQARALRLAGANSGQLDLTLHVIDTSGAEISPDRLPELNVTVYATATGDLQLPGARIAADRARVTRAGEHFRIEAPGGTVFLRIDGRGRAARRCAASWVRILAMPGFAERGAPGSTTTLSIPSCDASSRDLVEIPAGPFIYGGRGEPPTRYEGYVQPEETVALDSFAIDRIEVSNAAFAPFGAAAALTGFAVPQYPAGGVAGGAPEEPVTAIDAYEAEAYCRYMGKRLPSDYEWTKAARGAIEIGGVANPSPRRLYPWGRAKAPGCANLDGDADGFRWLAPVNALTCGASPYGVLQLAGNVDEWISRSGQLNKAIQPLRVVRGGAADSPPELEQGTTIFRNTREARYFSFATGMRCASDVDPEKGSIWSTH